MLLEGKYALVTGSSRGIGRGIALKLAESGVNVAVHYFQNQTAAKSTLGQVRERGAQGLIVQADVRKPEDISSMFSRVQAEFGKLDIFVSNARPELPEFYNTPLNITLDQWDTALDSQAKAFLVGTRQAVRLMPDGGRIIAITFAPGSRRGQPRRRWNPWYATLLSPWLVEELPSIPSVLASLKTVY